LKVQVSQLTGAVSKLIESKANFLKSATSVEAGGRRSLKSTSAGKTGEKVDADDSDSLPTPGAKITPLKTKPRATTTSLARDKELSKLLKVFNSGEARFHSTYETAGAANSTSRGERPRKALVIADYISRPEGHVSEDEDRWVASGGG
jgi:hypothetical protein